MYDVNVSIVCVWLKKVDLGKASWEPWYHVWSDERLFPDVKQISEVHWVLQIKKKKNDNLEGI
jgi:hypothetical protein